MMETGERPGEVSPTVRSPSRNGARITSASALALATLVIHFLTNSRYGYFRDELYYIACSRHLDSGYVDMAPLCAWILRLQSALFGDSLFALRLFPAIAGALTVALTCVLARELGGRTWAMALAGIAAMSAPIYLGLGNFYSMNVFEPLFWMGCIYLLVRIVNGADPRLWLAFGLLAGLGVENKHSFAFFGVGIVVALLSTPERRHLARPWIWLGGAIALALALPNILWQIRHHWATLELLRNVAHSDKNVVLGPAQFIGQQILIMNPATLPLWLGGLVWLFAARCHSASGPEADQVEQGVISTVGAGPPPGRMTPRYRLLAIAYIVTLAEFIILKGKHYYLAPVYPMLFAAGSVAAERLFALRFRWIKPALIAAMIAVAVLVAPTVLPILAPEKLLAYMQSIHFEPPRTEKSHTAALPQLFADQFGWEEMVRSLARAYDKLLPEDRNRVGIFCQNYGQAGAIDFFGPKYGLPPALCGHQNYYLWGPRDRTGELMLIIDSATGEEPKQFRAVEDLGVVESSPLAMPWEQHQHLYLCRDLKGSLSELWPKLKEWL